MSEPRRASRAEPTSNLRTMDEVAFQKLWEGISGRIVEGERITLALVELEPNGTVPSHEHPP